MKGINKTIDWRIAENGCWICTSHAAHPYPQIKRDGKKMQLARMIYEECFGTILPGMVLRHKCNNYLCINPEHLTHGTDLDNARDRIGTPTWTAGEGNAMHKLTEAQVAQIRKEFHYGLGNTLARKYNVSRSLITGITSRRFWKATA